MPISFEVSSKLGIGVKGSILARRALELLFRFFGCRNFHDWFTSRFFFLFLLYNFFLLLCEFIIFFILLLIISLRLLSFLSFLCSLSILKFLSISNSIFLFTYYQQVHHLHYHFFLLPKVFL